MSARAQQAVGAEEPFKAPLFASMLERLRDGERHAVLELGPARRAMLQRLSGTRCRLEVVDLPSMLPPPPLDDDDADAQLAQWTESVLLPPHDEPLDAVLAWDLINHLPPKPLQTLSAAVAARARPGALMHALVVYASRTMCEQPAPWDALAEDRLQRQPCNGPHRDAPRYSPDDLARLMPDWRVDRAILLRNGMQEFLLRR